MKRKRNAGHRGHEAPDSASSIRATCAVAEGRAGTGLLPVPSHFNWLSALQNVTCDAGRVIQPALNVLPYRRALLKRLGRDFKSRPAWKTPSRSAGFLTRANALKVAQGWLHQQIR